MENIMDFVTGIIFSYYFVVGLFLLAILLDHNERSGWSAFLAILSIYIVQDILTLTMMQTGILVALYVPIGLVWSGWRWKRHCSKVVNNLKRFYDENKEEFAKNEKIPEAERTVKVEGRDPWNRSIVLDEKSYIDSLKANNNIGNILSWTFSWPISICSSMFSDIIDVVETFIRTRLIGIYNRISSNAMDEASKYKEEQFK
jgi:hypothetical protein